MGKDEAIMEVFEARALRACFKNGARLCRRPAAAREPTGTRGNFEVCCGWSRTTQPRSGFLKHALSCVCFCVLVVFSVHAQNTFSPPRGYVAAHDPSTIIKGGSRYYQFSTG